MFECECMYVHALVKSRCLERPRQSWVRIRDLFNVCVCEMALRFLIHRVTNVLNHFLNHIQSCDHFINCGHISRIKSLFDVSHFRDVDYVGLSYFRPEGCTELLFYYSEDHRDWSVLCLSSLERSLFWRRRHLLAGARFRFVVIYWSFEKKLAFTSVSRRRSLFV